MLKIRKIQRLFHSILTILLIVTFLSSNIFAADIFNGFPTVFVLKGAVSQQDGYLISSDRLDKCVLAVQDAKTIREKYNLDTKFLKDSMNTQKTELDLTLTKERSERKYVEDGLKQRLAEKEAWYRQPLWVAAGVTVLLLVIFGTASSLTRK